MGIAIGPAPLTVDEMYACLLRWQKAGYAPVLGVDYGGWVLKLDFNYDGFGGRTNDPVTAFRFSTGPHPSPLVAVAAACEVIR